jgi:hypothetical protein
VLVVHTINLPGIVAPETTDEATAAPMYNFVLRVRANERTSRTLAVAVVVDDDESEPAVPFFGFSFDEKARSFAPAFSMSSEPPPSRCCSIVHSTDVASSSW